METRVCTNCAFCDRFDYGPNDSRRMMRCWHHPDVCDHARVTTIAYGSHYVCDEHRFKEERDKELYEEAKEEYARYGRMMKKLEEKYPQIKEDVQL